jgi:hypothetical protein
MTSPFSSEKWVDFLQYIGSHSVTHCKKKFESFKGSYRVPNLLRESLFKSHTYTLHTDQRVWCPFSERLFSEDFQRIKNSERQISEKVSYWGWGCKSEGEGEMYFRGCAFRAIFFAEKVVRLNVFRWTDTISYDHWVWWSHEQDKKWKDKL